MLRDCVACKASWHVEVLDTEQPSESEGMFFYFNWVPAFGTSTTSSDLGRQIDIKQCRHGEKVWQGSVRVWNGQEGGELGNSHGHREPFASAGSNQWEVGDIIVDVATACSQAEALQLVCLLFDTDFG